jgi:hypothetical protein
LFQENIASSLLKLDSDFFAEISGICPVLFPFHLTEQSEWNPLSDISYSRQANKLQKEVISGI